MNHRGDLRAGFRAAAGSLGSPEGMEKIHISSTDIALVFKERLAKFSDCAPTVAIAIVPSKDGWVAVTNAWSRFKRPLCPKRIEQNSKPAAQGLRPVKELKTFPLVAALDAVQREGVRSLIRLLSRSG
jgi:hypothetical protein